MPAIHHIVLSVTRNALPLNTVLPAISGNPRVGEVLTATTGTWTAQPTGYVIVWYRGNSSISVGSTYVPTASDVSSTLTVQVTATNAAGSNTAQSLPTQAVSPASTPTGDTILLENGSRLLLENGSYVLIEAAAVVTSDTAILLENGSRLLLENGSILLQEAASLPVASGSAVLMESGSRILLESGSILLIEADPPPPVATGDVLLMENGDRLLLESGFYILRDTTLAPTNAFQDTSGSYILDVSGNYINQVS